MIETDNDYLLFIEPTQPASAEPVQDELTFQMRKALETAMPGPLRYRGVHQCVCGMRSTNENYILRKTGQMTNSLAVHYLEYHRDEVPERELKKVQRL